MTTGWSFMRGRESIWSWEKERNRRARGGTAEIRAANCRQSGWLGSGIVIPEIPIPGPPYSTASAVVLAEERSTKTDCRGGAEGGNRRPLHPHRARREIRILPRKPGGIAERGISFHAPDRRYMYSYVAPIPHFLRFSYRDFFSFSPSRRPSSCSSFPYRGLSDIERP